MVRERNSQRMNKSSMGTTFVNYEGYTRNSGLFSKTKKATIPHKQSVMGFVGEEAFKVNSFGKTPLSNSMLNPFQGMHFFDVAPHVGEEEIKDPECEGTRAIQTP